MLVVADNSPLRYLCVLDCASVLPVLFGRILIPQAVFDELQHPKTPTVVRTWLADPPAWLEVCPIVGRPDATLSTLESGEQEAIVLAQELHADILLVDDGKARDVAIQRGLRVMGTVGVLEQAVARGLVVLPEVFTRLLSTNFRILRTIVNDVLARDAARKSQEGDTQD